MSLLFLQAAQNATDLTTYTFAAQNLGVVASDRHIIVALAARSTGATTLSSVFVGGVGATIVANVANSAGGNTSRTAFAIAAVPTGATGDVVVTFSGGQLRCGIGVYRADKMVSSTPTDTATSIADDPTQNTLDVTANGCALATAMQDATTTATWVGLETENFDAVVETGTQFSGASQSFVATQTNLTITCDWGSGTLAAGSFASWAFNPDTPLGVVLIGNMESLTAVADLNPVTPIFTWRPNTCVQTTKHRTQSANFGDGFEQRVSDGLNTAILEFSLTFDTMPEDEGDDVCEFIDARKATEYFLWTPPRGLQGKYVCTEPVRRTWNPDVDGESDISLTFRQVFDL